MRPYPPRVRRDLDVVPRGNPRRALATKSAVNQELDSGFGVSTPHAEVCTLTTSVFLPRMEL